MNKSEEEIAKPKARQLFDKIYLQWELFWKVWITKWNDLKLLSLEKGGLIAAKGFYFFSNFLSWIVKTDRNKLSFWPLIIIKLFVVVSFIFFAGIPLLLAILIGGSAASILGLRNLGEYSFKEQIAAWSVIVSVIFLAPLFCSEYSLYTINIAMAYAVGIVGLDLLYGQCGIISLGQGGFLFIGGYIVVWLFNGMLGFHLPIYVSLIFGAIGTGLVGGLLGIPALRVKENYLVIVSIASSMSVPAILKSKYFVTLSGNRVGGLFLAENKPPGFLFFIPQHLWLYFLVAVPTLILFFIAHNIIHHSQIGRAFRAIKTDNEITMILGVPVVRYKLLAFSLSALYAGFSGGFLIIINKVISPDSYSVFTSRDFLMANIVGGAGGLFGSVIGGAFLTFEPSVIHFISEYVPNGKNLTHAVYGVILLVVVLFFPTGIAGELSRIVKSRFRRNIRRANFKISPPPDFDYLEATKQYFPKK